MKEDRVAAEPFGQARDGGFGAVKRSRDLTMRRAGHQPRRDRGEKITAPEVVRRRKRLERPGLAAGFAAEVRDSGRGQNGGRNRAARTDSPGCFGRRMNQEIARAVPARFRRFTVRMVSAADAADTPETN
jgi:hypothetical protein